MALTPKQAKELKEVVFQEMNFTGLTLEGRTKEGLAFTTDEGDVVVIKVIAKKEDFDLADALNEYEEAEAKALEKEAKQKEKVVKAKTKKDKEALEGAKLNEKETDEAVDKILGIIEEVEGA